MTPKFELGRDFCTMHLYRPKFHHPMFTRSEVIVLTHKQTPLKTSNALRYATTLGKYSPKLLGEMCLAVTILAVFVGIKMLISNF